MELIRVTALDKNITAETQVCSYTYTGSKPIEIIIRVDTGDDNKPIVGGGTYTLNVYLNDVVVAPASGVIVADGKIRAIMVSRPVPLDANDVVSVRIAGLAGDTDVDVVTSIRDATPIKLSDVTGTGSIVVDHNYGGTDNLRCVNPNGGPVGGVTILAYLTSDYVAGRQGTPYVVARTATGPDGRWIQPLMLIPTTYTLICYVQGLYGPDRKDILVQ